MQPPASVYSKNFQALLNRFPDLARRIDAAPLPEAGAFALAKSGDLILTHNGTHLLSSYNPRRQADSLLRSRIAQRFPHSLPAPDCLTFLCLGLSLGYLPLGLVDFIRTRLPASAALPPLFVVEPEDSLFKAAMMAQDLSPLFSYPNLILLPHVQVQTVIDTLALNGTPEWISFSMASFEALNAPYYSDLTKALHQYESYWQVNLRTQQRFGSCWKTNLIHNLNRIRRRRLPVYPVSDLFHAFRQVPALIVAAGPSLDAHLPTLTAFRGRGVMIAVDTAAAFLQAHHLVPDFTVVSDCQYQNSRHLDGIDLSGQAVITELTVHPSLLDKNPSRLFLYNSKVPLAKAVESLLPPFGEIGTGGSVATSAWDAARLMGCDPIGAVGLDLAYTDGKTHCSHSLGETKSFAESNRFASAEQRNAQLLFQAQPIFPATEGPDAFPRAGEPPESPAFVGVGFAAGKDPHPESGGRRAVLKTDERMPLYAHWFSQQIKRFPGRYCRIAGGGYPISGMPWTTDAQWEALLQSAAPLPPDALYPAPKAALHFPPDLWQQVREQMQQALGTLCPMELPLNRLLQEVPFSAALCFLDYAAWVMQPPEKRFSFLSRLLSETLPRFADPAEK